MSNILYHPYHLVDESPWPLIASLSTFFIMIRMVLWFQTGSILSINIRLLRLLLTAFQWWRDISAEGCFQGHHTGVVELGLRLGIMLFIISEIFFFLSFFWCYFHISLSISIELGNSWHPQGVRMVSPKEIPLLNTIILLISGISITWAHHSMIESNYKETLNRLNLTIFLGLLFTGLQAIEYYELSFSIRDRVFGSVFFIATGFHGLHVIVGTLFLRFTRLRLIKGHFSYNHHFGFEARAWYWHFVDVVWLFLYITIYWWRWINF